MIEVVIKINDRRRLTINIENDESSTDPNVGNYDVFYHDEIDIIRGHFRLRDVTRNPDGYEGLARLLHATFTRLLERFTAL